MHRSQIILWIANAIAITVILLALWHSLIAPLLLFLGVLYLVAALALFASEKKINRFCVWSSAACLAIFIGAYFAPLWIAEQITETPEGHLKLAERFAQRGQLFGNLAKAHAHCQAAAESGNVEAQARLGEALYFGHYNTIDRVEGIKWLKVAAANGHRGAQQLVKTLETP